MGFAATQSCPSVCSGGDSHTGRKPVRLRLVDRRRLLVLPGRTPAAAGAADSLLAVPLADIMVTIQAAKILKDASADLGCVAAAAAAAVDFGRTMDRIPAPSREGLQFNDRQLAELIGALEYLLKTFRDEVDARPMFIMPPGDRPRRRIIVAVRVWPPLTEDPFGGPRRRSGPPSRRRDGDSAFRRALAARRRRSGRRPEGRREGTRGGCSTRL